MAEAANEILGAGGPDQRLQGFESRTHKRAQGACLGMHLLGRPGAYETNEPGGDRWQIAPPQ